MRPRIAITMGDPAGVGPEICLKALQDPNIHQWCNPLLFGDSSVLQRVATRLKLSLPDRVYSHTNREWCAATQPAIVDFSAISADSIEPGIVTAATGQAAYTYVVGATDAAIAGQIDAITTAPISKEALHAGGIEYPGHTEILADRTRTDRYCMMLTSPEISCCLVTTHVGLSQVPHLISKQRIMEVIELGAAAIRKIHNREPRIAVLGLNPHAGEHGLFGEREEERFIEPAIAAARKSGLDVSGPHPADTAFLKEKREETDVYVCMYHDQGLIPLKTLSFEIAVNVTLGLPIIRTSVDHGTACDLAWKGTASASSIQEAVRLATRLAAQR